MNYLSREQMRDLMHAVRHYQYHHISVNNPRHEEFSNILNVLEEAIPHENFPGYCRRCDCEATVSNWLDDGVTTNPTLIRSRGMTPGTSMPN